MWLFAFVGQSPQSIKEGLALWGTPDWGAGRYALLNSCSIADVAALESYEWCHKRPGNPRSHSPKLHYGCIKPDEPSSIITQSVSLTIGLLAPSVIIDLEILNVIVLKL